MYFKRWVKSYAHVSKKRLPIFLLKGPIKMEIEEEIINHNPSAVLVKRITQENVLEDLIQNPQKEVVTQNSLQDSVVKKTKITDLEL